MQYNIYKVYIDLLFSL